MARRWKTTGIWQDSSLSVSAAFIVRVPSARVLYIVPVFLTALNERFFILTITVCYRSASS